jgi:hypothetical protein
MVDNEFESGWTDDDVIALLNTSPVWGWRGYWNPLKPQYPARDSYHEPPNKSHVPYRFSQVLFFSQIMPRCTQNTKRLKHPSIVGDVIIKKKEKLSLCTLGRRTGEALGVGEWSALSPHRLTPWKERPVRTVQEAMWSPEPVWRFRRTENLLPLPGFEPRMVSTVTKSLHTHVLPTSLQKYTDNED